MARKAKPKRVKTIVDGHKENFECLRKAFAQGDVCLAACTLLATGEKVAVICAVNNDTDKEENIQLVPMAMFFNGNPYELLEAPMENPKKEAAK